jgi:hypothetical protein
MLKFVMKSNQNKLLLLLLFDGNGRCTALALRRKKNNTEFGYTKPAEAWQAEITSTNT